MTINSGKLNGAFKKTVIICSNDPKHSKSIISVKADVYAEFKTVPGELRFKNGQKTLEFKVESTGNKKFSIKSVDYNRECLDITWKNRGKQILFKAILKKAPEIAFRETVTIIFTDRKRFELRISGKTR